MKQRTQELLEAADLLAGDIRTGLFTPFLGAGASSLRSGEIDLESYPWREVAMTLTAISMTLSKRSRDFLRSFTKHRLNLVSEAEVNRIVPVTDGPHSPTIGGTDLCETLLVKLQVELVRATVRLTHYFGVRFSEESPSIHHLEDCSVSFDLSSEEQTGALARDCLMRLFAAADLALELQRRTSGQRESPFLFSGSGVQRCLERKRLYDKLLTLVIGLIGKNRDSYLDELGKHRVGRHFPIPYEVELGKTASYGNLRLDAIQWLSDLLWYTVRYWVPCYPTTAELAFELSLAVKDAPPRRAELAQAAQALENECASMEGENLLAKITGDLVRYCETVQERKEGPGWQAKAFYYAIAAALQYQFEKYRKAVAAKADSASQQVSLKDKFKPGKVKSETPSFQPKFPVPIVFTTNFDSALEKVFEANDVCFHIVFPVLRGSSMEDEAVVVAPSWMVRTVYPKSRNLSPPAEDWKSFCHIDDNGSPQISFEGPIIVKLHGSPAQTLAESTTQHWLVLSEAGYLEALDGDSRVPAWLGNQLSSQESKEGNKPVPRSLWFLGYSISDWNVRLRLYEHCKEHRKLGGRRSTVDWSADVYRTAILGKLDVDQCLGDLNELPMMIYAAFEDGERNAVCSDKVRQLMDGIRENLPRNQR